MLPGCLCQLVGFMSGAWCWLSAALHCHAAQPARLWLISASLKALLIFHQPLLYVTAKSCCTWLPADLDKLSRAWQGCKTFCLVLCCNTRASLPKTCRSSSSCREYQSCISKSCVSGWGSVGLKYQLDFARPYKTVIKPRRRSLRSS